MSLQERRVQSSQSVKQSGPRGGGRDREAGERGVEAGGGGGHQIQPDGIHACSRQNQVGTSCPTHSG